MTTKSGKVHKLKISKEKESRKIRQVGFTILNIDKKSTDKKIVIKESKEYKNVEFLNAVENISKPNFGLPEDIKVYSMAKDGEYIDILNWVKGHNIITKIKVYSMAEDGEYIDISNWVKGYSVITKIEVCAFLADQLPDIKLRYKNTGKPDWVEELKIKKDRIKTKESGFLKTNYYSYEHIINCITHESMTLILNKIPANSEISIILFAIIPLRQ